MVDWLIDHQPEVDISRIAPSRRRVWCGEEVEDLKPAPVRTYLCQHCGAPLSRYNRSDVCQICSDRITRHALANPECLDPDQTREQQIEILRREFGPPTTFAAADNTLPWSVRAELRSLRSSRLGTKSCRILNERIRATSAHLLAGYVASLD